jgi:site-specific DNA-cytosine methylase
VKGKRASTPDDDETWKEGEVAPTLNAFDNGGDSRATVVTVEGNEPVSPTYSFDSTFSAQSRVFEDQTPPVKCGSGLDIPSPPAVGGADLAVRRLTPTECERLMGWPDGWTAVGINEDGAEVVVADSSRYRMCGNGVASPVAEWIGRCIVAAEQELNG